MVDVFRFNCTVYVILCKQNVSSNNCNILQIHHFMLSIDSAEFSRCRVLFNAVWQDDLWGNAVFLKEANSISVELKKKVK